MHRSALSISGVEAALAAEQLFLLIAGHLGRAAQDRESLSAWEGSYVRIKIFNRGWTKRTGSLARVVDAVMWQQRSLRTAIIGRLRRLLCGLSFTNAHINARKRARYAILLDSVWQDVAKDIYISDVVRFLPTGDKFNDDDSSSVPR